MRVRNPNEAVNRDEAHKKHQELVLRSNTCILSLVKLSPKSKELDHPNNIIDATSNDTEKHCGNVTLNLLLTNGLSHLVVLFCQVVPHDYTIDTTSYDVQN